MLGQQNCIIYSGYYQLGVCLAGPEIAYIFVFVCLFVYLRVYMYHMHMKLHHVLTIQL